MGEQLRSVRVQRFKGIQDAPCDLSPINVFIGANNSGKSTIAQMVHFGVSILQAINLTKGFTPVPRTMPLIGAIMDALAGKGKPVSTTFLELWCRADEQGFQVVSKPQEVAFASGFITERGLTTWRERMRKLIDLRFITAKPGASGDFHYVQIWNPYVVIKEHAQIVTSGFPERHYHALVERVHEIGATDLADVAVD